MITTLLAILALLPATPQDGPQGGPPPEPVHVDTVKREEIQARRMVTGELRALRRSHVAGQEPGLIVEMLVREGQTVSRGDVIARLDTGRLEITLRQVEADTAVAKAVLEEREAEVLWKERDLELIRTAFDGGAANTRTLGDAVSTLGMARARAAQASSQIALNRAKHELLERRLEDSTIVAPFDGVVVARLLDEGEWYGEGDTMVELVSTGPLEAWMNVPQGLLGAVQGRKSTVVVRNDSNGNAHEVSDHRVVPQVNSIARTFQLVAVLENREGLMTPGMSVTAWVPTEATERLLTVPSDAILRNETGPYVYVPRQAGPGPARAMPAQVEVLFPHGGRTVVRSRQLEEGDLVVVEGNERLFPSRPVTPIPVAAPADLRTAGGRP